MVSENKKIGSHNKLATLLSFLIALNVFDAIMTLIWTHYSIAEEANPLMLYLLEIHPVLFLFIKISLVFFIFIGVINVFYTPNFFWIYF